MAKLRAFEAMDMTDLSSQIGSATYADRHLLVVSTWDFDTHYYGSFTYPNDQWKGTISKVFLYRDGYELGHITGLHLDTRYATAGTTTQSAYRKALSGDDVFVGSRDDDRLVGYAGDDVMRGDRGDDWLNGSAHRNDELAGGAGNDILTGSSGKDALVGGNGNDALRGGSDRDHFVFDGHDGRDKVWDFEDGVDRIRIEDGAERYRDLDIRQVGDDVQIAFSDTMIVVRHADAHDFTGSDLLFRVTVAPHCEGRKKGYSMTIEVKQLAHACVFARDLAETRDFYRDVLGLETVFNFTRDGAWFGFYLRAGDRSHIEVFAKPEASYSDSNQINHFCLEVASIEAAVAHIRARGVAVTDPKLAIDDTWQAWITDPNGVRIELFEYTPKSAQFTGGDRVATWRTGFRE